MRTATDDGDTPEGAPVRWRAVACVTDADLGRRLVVGLAAAGIEATLAADLECAADAVSSGDGVPMLVVLDATHEGWIGAVAKLTERNPLVRTLVVAEIEGDGEMLSAVAAGVTGFCSPADSLEAIGRTVRSVIETGVAIPRSYVAPLVRELRRGRGHRVRTHAGEVAVTDREWEILQMLVQRRSTREMADHLYVSVGTVRSHVSSLLAKLDAVDRADAVQMVMRSTMPDAVRPSQR